MAVLPPLRLLPREHLKKHSEHKMRQNRSKAYRKLMAMYTTSFGFRQPYQVLGTCVIRVIRTFSSLHTIVSGL
jgi:hypothetical protein